MARNSNVLAEFEFCTWGHRVLYGIGWMQLKLVSCKSAFGRANTMFFVSGILKGPTDIKRVDFPCHANSLVLKTIASLHILVSLSLDVIDHIRS